MTSDDQCPGDVIHSEALAPENEANESQRRNCEAQFHHWKPPFLAFSYQTLRKIRAHSPFAQSEVSNILNGVVHFRKIVCTFCNFGRLVKKIKRQRWSGAHISELIRSSLFSLSSAMISIA